MKLALALAAGLIFVQATKQPPTAPPAAPVALVLIVCKGHTEAWSNDTDADNAKMTGVENWVWDYPDAKMLCKRLEIPMIDPAEAAGAAPLNPNFSDWSQCARAGIPLQQSWDQAHRTLPWRVWRIGCPVPIINQDGSVVGYKMPDGGHYEQVTFLVDSAI